MSASNRERLVQPIEDAEVADARPRRLGVKIGAVGFGEFHYIFLSAASASSRARTLDSRPTTKGVIM